MAVDSVHVVNDVVNLGEVRSVFGWFVLHPPGFEVVKTRRETVPQLLGAFESGFGDLLAHALRRARRAPRPLASRPCPSR